MMWITNGKSVRKKNKYNFLVLFSLKIAYGAKQNIVGANGDQPY